MKDSKNTFAGLIFLTNLFRVSVFLIIGIVLCLFGIKVYACMVVGGVLIAFAFLVAIIMTIYSYVILKNSDHPAMKGLYEAITSDTPYRELDKYTEQLEKDTYSDNASNE